ncbi:hypothetical protein ACE10X_13235 [Bradyrhizobium sp. Pha-3]|uniref:hypothetical protein n=1 Tax=Bradyrhizobium sp. Pha-3 TaxID=208375 RepID=UPI0035D47E07
MPRQANGTYQQPANTAAVSGQPISSTAYNTLIPDLGNEITNSLDRGGRSAMTAPLPMGNQKIIGMADPTIPTDGATKNYVDNATAAFFGTGDAKLTLKTVADAGWVFCDDGTIGSATSGSSNRANNDTQALFTLIFNVIVDAYAPILTSGGGATTRSAQVNAATAWAANCRIMLPRTLGRVLGVAGNGTGSGLSARGLGQFTGVETQTLAISDLPVVTVLATFNGTGITGGTVAGSVTISGGTVTYPVRNYATSGSSVITDLSLGSNIGSSAGTLASSTLSGATATFSGGTIQSGIPTGTVTCGAFGAGAAHNNMQPTTFLNLMIKL